MDDVEVIGTVDEIYNQISNLMISKELPYDIAYYIVGSIFCRLSLEINRPLAQILKDIENTFKSLPSKNTEEK